MEKYTTLLEVIKNSLNTLSHLLDKASEHVKEKGIGEEVVLHASIAPDMFNFSRQIQIATDDARRNLYLLAGKEHIKMEDNEKSIEELKARVTKNLELISALTEKDFEGADERKITLFWMKDKHVLGKDFVNEFAFSNFFFHIVTAYNILRKEGVTIGKMDFITKFSMRDSD